MYLYPIAINIVIIDLLRIFTHLYSQKSSILFKVLINIKFTLLNQLTIKTM